jgi:hypothetical protein
MHPTKWILSALAAVELAGCATTGVADLSYVRASDVINSLKDELAFVDSHPIGKRITVSNESCGDQKGDEKSVFVTGNFQTADVSLKTIATDTVSGTVTGSKLPIGAVLIGVSGSLTRSTIRTQQVTYTLTNVQAPKVSRARVEEVPNIPFDPADNGGLKIRHETLSAGATDAGTAGVTAENVKPHPIADAILAARDELLAVDHMRRPCLLPSKIKVEIDFQVQKKLDVKSDVAFLVFLDVAAESVRQREAANSMVVTFDLTGSSQSLR